eukprot:2470557-Rhodomonas_salina.1
MCQQPRLQVPPPSSLSTYRERERERERERGTGTDKDRDLETHRLTDSQTHRHTDTPQQPRLHPSYPIPTTHLPYAPMPPVTQLATVCSYAIPTARCT